MNIPIKELISQKNTSKLLALKSNDSYLITYNYVGIKYVRQINWLKKKICRQLNDSSCSLDNFEFYERIYWHENKMCRQLDDSYLPVRNDLDNYGIYGNNIYVHHVHYDQYSQINWLENKLCRQLDDSYLPAKYVGKARAFTYHFIQFRNVA